MTGHESPIPEDPFLDAELLERILADREAGLGFPLTHYQELFPGHEDAVAREFESLSDAGKDESGQEDEADIRAHSRNEGTDTQDPVAAFAHQYWIDQAEGNPKSLKTYLSLFPGQENGIAQEYLRLQKTASRSTGEDPVTFIGPYKIERELGRGGQATVYLATDTRLGRRIALKVLTGMIPISEELLERFRREAAVASRLDHPGICTVYESAWAGTYPYIAMRYIDGITLAQHIAASGQAKKRAGSKSCHQSIDGPKETVPRMPEPRQPSSGPRTRGGIRDMDQLIEQVARALHVAHEAGLVHRDIKPGNIMITPDGNPVILDFGLARDETSDIPSVTLSGQLVGTPAYMSPEQLTTSRRVIDRRSDVYSLGVTLYECLTSRRPFEGATREQIFQRILDGDPPNPRHLNPGIPGEIKVTIETALDKSLNRRYQTAEAFAEDLRRWQHNVPIQARPVSLMRRTVKLVLRHPARAVAVSAALLAIVSGTILLVSQKVIRDRAVAGLLHHAEVKLDEHSFTQALSYINQALGLDQDSPPALRLRGTIEKHQREQAEKRQKEAEDAQASAVRNSYVASIRGACMSLQANNFVELRLLLDACPSALRGWEWQHLSLRQGPTLMRIPPSTLAAAAVFPTHILSRSQSGVQVRDTTNGKIQHTIKLEGYRPLSFAVSADGKRIFIWGSDEKVHAHEASTGKLIKTLTRRGADVPSDRARGPRMSASADGNRVAADGGDHTISIWNVATGVEVTRIQVRRWIRDFAISPDGKQLAWIDDTTVHLSDIGPWIRDSYFAPILGSGDSVTFSPDGVRIAIGGGHLSGTWIWDVRAKKVIASLELPNCENIEFSPDGRFVLVTSTTPDNSLHVWHIESKTQLLNLRTHDFSPSCAVYTPDGERIITSGKDDEIRVWDAATQDVVTVLPGRRSSVHSVAAGPQGRRIVAACPDAIRVWDARTGDLQATLRGSGYRLAISQDGKRVVAATGMKVLTWDLTTRKQIAAFRMGKPGFASSPRPISALAISPDGERIAAVGNNEEEVQVQTMTGNLLAVLKGNSPTDHFLAVRFTSDGNRIVTAGYETVQVWEAATGKLLGSATLIPAPDGYFHDNPMKILTGGKNCVVGFRNNQICQWDLSSGQVINRLQGHGSPVTLAVSPDGTRVASTSEKQPDTIRLWDLETGDLLARFRTRCRHLTAIAFSPDSARMVTGARSGHVLVWDSQLASARRLWRGAARRRRAESIVDDLYNTNTGMAEMIRGLETRHDVDEKTRSDALRLLLAQKKPSCEELNRASRDIVNRPGRSPVQYEQALCKATVAFKRKPGNAYFASTNGISLFRMGRYNEAIRVLARADILNQESEVYNRAIDLLFLAMSHHQLGRTDRAQKLMDEARDSAGSSRDRELLDFFREATTLMSVHKANGGEPISTTKDGAVQRESQRGIPK